MKAERHSTLTDILVYNTPMLDILSSYHMPLTENWQEQSKGEEALREHVQR